MKLSSRQTLVVLAVITLLGLLLRLPYWDIIPAADDEVGQSVYALQILDGRYPLVANDAYNGPFYVYLLALLFKLGVNDPLIGRWIVLIAGVLLIPISYGFVLALGATRYTEDRGFNRTIIAGLITAVLVAVNPYLILVNSHLGGFTYLLPFFVTWYLWWLATAVARDSVGWLIGAGIIGGLAIQSNPLGAIPVGMGLIWLLFAIRNSQLNYARNELRIAKLGHYWPVWPFIAGVIVLLVYSPVLYYNLTTDLQTLDVLQERSYLWEDNPTLTTTISNGRRLLYQLTRQLSGVLQGDETIRPLIGLPLVYLGLAIAGIVHMVRRVSWLPLLVVTPFLLIFPYASSHYGYGRIGRFTTMLLPPLLAGIGFLLVDWGAKIRRSRWQMAVGGVLTLLLIGYPLLMMRDYVATVQADLRDGRSILTATHWIVDHHQPDERVYLSERRKLDHVPSVLYVPSAYFIFNGIHHEFLPTEQILGRLYAYPQPTTLILADEDLPAIEQIAQLIPIDTGAMTSDLGYGVYQVATAVALNKPDFVTDASAIPPDLAEGGLIGDGAELLGCQSPPSATAGETITVTCFWQAIAPMPDGNYMGFVHLFDPATGTLLAQDDHILGRERYPLNAWQAGEVVVDVYTLQIPNETAVSPTAVNTYDLWVGIYTWPDLIRLDVPNSDEDVVRLQPLAVSN